MKMKDAVLLWHDKLDIFKVVPIGKNRECEDEYNLMFSHGRVFCDWEKWIKNKEYLPALILDILYGFPHISAKTILDEFDKKVEDAGEYIIHPSRIEKLPF